MVLFCAASLPFINAYCFVFPNVDVQCLWIDDSVPDLCNTAVVPFAKCLVNVFDVPWQ